MITNYEDFKKILPLDSISSVLTQNWTSPFSGVSYVRGQYALIVFNREMDQYKIRKDLEEEAKKKRAAAAAKAWSSAQASAGAKAELAQIKSAQAYQKAQEELEEAQKAKAAAAAKAWNQSQDIDAINAKTSEIRRQTAMINADSAAAAAKSYSAADQQQVINEANAAQENAAMNENLPVLPEVEVKSDFGKYLLIGGAALAIFYFMSKKKKG